MTWGHAHKFSSVFAVCVHPQLPQEKSDGREGECTGMGHSAQLSSDLEPALATSPTQGCTEILTALVSVRCTGAQPCTQHVLTESEWRNQHVGVALVTVLQGNCQVKSNL